MFAAAYGDLPSGKLSRGGTRIRAKTAPAEGSGLGDPPRPNQAGGPVGSTQRLDPDHTAGAWGVDKLGLRDGDVGRARSHRAEKHEVARGDRILPDRMALSVLLGHRSRHVEALLGEDVG